MDVHSPCFIEYPVPPARRWGPICRAEPWTRPLLLPPVSPGPRLLRLLQRLHVSAKIVFCFTSSAELPARGASDGFPIGQFEHHFFFGDDCFLFPFARSPLCLSLLRPYIEHSICPALAGPHSRISALDRPPMMPADHRESLIGLPFLPYLAVGPPTKVIEIPPAPYSISLILVCL